MLKATAFLLNIILICTSALMAQSEYPVEEIFSWDEKTNFIGSPNGYYYIPADKKVAVYSSGGNQVFSMGMQGNEKIYASPSGNFWGRAVFIDASADQLRVREFSMYNPSGKKIYTIQNPGALNFILNDQTAGMVGVEGSEGLPETLLHFFGKSGQRIGERKISNFLHGRYAADGSLFFAYSSDSGLLVFDADGVEIYRLNAGRRFGASRDGKLVLAVNGSGLSLYYQNNLAQSIKSDFAGIREIILADGGQTALLLAETSLTSLSLPELTTNWVYRLANKSEYFGSCQWDPEMNKIALGIAIDLGPDYPFASRYSRGRVEVLNNLGEKLGTTELSYERWSRGCPRVFFSSDGRMLWVLSDSNLQRISIE